MEILFKAKMRLVFSDVIANNELKKKIDAIKIDLDGANRDILSISGSEITSEKTITCIAIVLSKTEQTYDLPSYLQKIRAKVTMATEGNGLKLIDIHVM